MEVKAVSHTPKQKFFNKLKLLLRGVQELAGFCFSGSGQIRFLFLTKSTYRTLFNGVYFDKFCDAIVDMGGISMKENSAILESGVDFAYRRPRPKSPRVFEVQGLLFITRLIADIWFLFAPGRIMMTSFANFRRELETRVGRPIRLDEKQIHHYIVRTLFLSRLFEFFLKKHSVEKVFSICYYEDFGYAMNIACHRLGIKSFDIQHGVQGKYHPAYAPMSNIPEGGYQMLPDVFWVWNRSSFENINLWRTPFHKAFLGGNPWIDFCASHRSAEEKALGGLPIILVTLQPIADPLPGFLLKTMSATVGQYKWCVRLHPRQFSEKELIRKQLVNEGLDQHVEMELSSQLPLPILLMETKVHVTQWSSVVIEAFELGVPSVVIHKTGELVYSKEEFSEYVYYAYTSREIEEAIQKAPTFNRKSETLIADRCNVVQEIMM
jgi:hypothetical protein